MTSDKIKPFTFHLCSLSFLVTCHLLLVTFPAFSQNSENYEISPDSKPQAGVPRGEVLKFTFDRSQIFPGTIRDYWVYVPAQYSPNKPACLYVNQDGIQWQAPTVFDNLIAKKEMPVTIGVFVMHGRVKADDEKTALDRFNRSYEYDGLGDNYVRFLLTELLPEVETRTTSDGRPIRFSHDGNDHAIGGSSSGAIAAFTAAWERPDAFTRVFSSIGTYVGLRGGDRYSTLVRKYEPKPIRVFLQDGSHDLNIYAGDWWMANQMMERSLIFAGYEVQHVWGEGEHNGKQGTAIFPDVMRWLWKDWPQPVKKGQSKNATLGDILLPEENWQLADSKKSDGQAFGPDNRLYRTVPAEKKIIAYDKSGKANVLANGIRGHDIIVAHNGNMYVTEPGADNGAAGKIWLLTPKGEKKVVDTNLLSPNGIAISPDQTLLYADDYRSHWVYSYRIQPDGSLQDKQRYGWLHVPDASEESGADGMRVDADGRLYVATRLGIQVCDQLGRVNAIIPTPNGQASNLSFGGSNFDTLFATCGNKIYSRKLKVKGANSWGLPIKPAAPRL